MNRRATKPVIFLIIFILVVFSINLLGLCKGTRGVFNTILSPVQKLSWNVGKGVSNFFENIFTLHSFKEENEKLLSYNKQLMEKVSRLGLLEDENEFLRNSLDLGLGDLYDMSLGSVISKEMFGDLILIKVEEGNVSKDSPVLTKDKIVCGKVSNIYNNAVEVSLLSNKDNTYSAEIITEGERVEGVLRGRNNFGLYVDLIPKDKEIKEGDIVVTSSLGDDFPEGLVIGVIKEIKKDDASPYIVGEVDFACDVDDLKNLLIINNFK
jgi:rod shape-determining protein MreC